MALVDTDPTVLSGTPQVASEPASRNWIYLAVAAALGVGAAFFPLFRWLPNLWFGDDSYYAHGAVIPICSALIIWDRWPKLKELPIKPATWAIIPLAGLLYVTWFAHRTDMRTFQSALLLMVLAFSVLFVAGRRWLMGVAIPLGYLAFGLPLFDRFVDQYTQWIQRASTELSFVILKAFQMRPLRLDTSTIMLDKFTLDIGVACSGMKLLLAVMAISVFFMLIAKLKLVGNLILLAAVIPLTLVVNSLRIVMIGWVGNTWGDAAGHQFHDYSGYISLVLCFVLLMKLTKVLGWK